MIKITSQKKKCEKEKWVFEEALQIAEKRREAKGKGEKERDWERLDISSRKLDTKGTFHAKMGT